MRPHRRQPTRLPRPWDSPGKNTGVGCHFLLQCMTVKSESEVAQSCLTLRDPMDCSLPGSSVHGIFQARVLEWGAIAFSMPTRNGKQKDLHVQEPHRALLDINLLSGISMSAFRTLPGDMGRRADSLFLRVEEHLEPSGMEKMTHCLPASDSSGLH